MLLDWIAYLREGRRAGAKLAQANPKMVEGYQALSAGQNGNGALDARTRELIALACAVTLRCDGCITVHSEAARKLGATSEEVAEALGVAVALNAGAALVYSTRTLDAFAAAGEAGPGAA